MRNHCRRKAINVQFLVCVCSFSYSACRAHAPYYTVTCGLPDSAIFFHIAHKRYDFRKHGIENKLGVLISLQLLSETFFSLRRIQQDIITNVIRSSGKVHVILVGF